MLLNTFLKYNIEQYEGPNFTSKLNLNFSTSHLLDHNETENSNKKVGERQNCMLYSHCKLDCTYLLASTESKDGVEVELGRFDPVAPPREINLFMDSFSLVARSSLWARNFLSASKK